MRSACRCRRACPRRCSSRSPIRSPIWCAGSAARTVRSPARTSARAWASASRWSMPRWRGCSPPAAWSMANSGPAAAAASGATPRCCARVRQRSLARLRQEVEPVDATALGRFLVHWHGLARQRHGLDGLLDVIEQLQGVPIAASVLESEVLAARVQRLLAGDARHAARRRRSDVGRRGAARRARRPRRVVSDRSRLDAAAAGCACDGKRNEGLTGRDAQLVAHLRRHGASFFGPLHEAGGGGFPQETVDAIWDLVWKGLLTNDTLHALRAYAAPPERARRPSRDGHVPIAAADSAVGRGPLDAGAAAGGIANGVGHGHGAPTADAARRGHARCDGDRATARRILRDVSGVAPARRNRAHPPRLLRRRPGRGAVRAAGRDRFAARCARGTRRGRHGHDLGDRSGESVRRVGAVAPSTRRGWPTSRPRLAQGRRRARPARAW